MRGVERKGHTAVNATDAPAPPERTREAKAPAPPPDREPAPTGAYAIDTRGSARTTRTSATTHLAARSNDAHGGPGALPPALVDRAKKARVPYEVDRFSRAPGRAPDPSYHANAVEAGLAFAAA